MRGSSRVATSHVRVREKPPPEWGGVCELLTRGELCPWPSEKPPPEWGGVCEFTDSEREILLSWRNPHRSGEVVARISDSGNAMVNDR